MADLAQVARTVAAAVQGDGAGLLDRLCQACTRVLPVEGTAISMMADAARPLAKSASDAWVTRLEELQFTLGEGPGVAAFTRGEPAWAADLERGDPDWPMFAHEASALVADAGWRVRAVFAFPLQLGRDPLGVVDLYRRQPGPLSAEGLAQARVAVDTAAMALVAAAIAAEQRGSPSWLQQTSEDGVEVDQAVGMVMAQIGLGPEEALARLRGHAFAQGSAVGEVARAVIARELRFPREDR